MKSILSFLATFAVTGLFAQNNQIYGKFTKSDGAIIKGSSTKRGFENNVIITNYTGGSDNSAVIEIETVTNTYVAEFRNIMNAANAATAPRPQAVALGSKTSVAPATKATLSDKISPTMTAPVQQQQQQPTITKIEITVAPSNVDAFLKPATKIILEDIKIESCSDNAATGTSKIKLRGNRIGWIYYSYDIKGKMTSSKSGWNTIAGQAWSNF